MLPHIELNRRFWRLGDTEEHDPDALRMRAALGLGGETWSDLLEQSRVVILAEAGTGKTHELRETARRLGDEGQKAFFCRIEDLAEISLEEAIEIGSLEEFKGWSEDGDDPGFFFLDSVDEARLKHGRYFERALGRLAKALGSQAPRARVFISARVSDWRATADLSVVKAVLPSPKVEPVAEPESVDDQPPTDGISIVQLAPLAPDQIRRFALAQGVGDADSFVDAIKRADAEIFAERPQDLIELIAYWMEHRMIGSHAEMIEFNIKKKLAESNLDRDAVRPLSPKKASEGAMSLAAALTFAKKGAIVVPDQPVEPSRATSSIDARDVLPDWTASERGSLLTRPLFDEATYGRVRLHHRSVQEYLTSQWLQRLLANGKKRRDIEGLLFTKQYNVDVMLPSMKPVAAWLALRDEHVRGRIIAIAPEVLIEHGDPSRLPVSVRSQLLCTFAQLNEGRTNTGASLDLASLRRLADPELATTVLDLLDRRSANRDLQQALLGVIWQGQLADCAESALSLALEPSTDRHTRILGIRAVAAAGDQTLKDRLAGNLLSKSDDWSHRELGEAVAALFPDSLTLEELLVILEGAEPPKEFSVDALDEAVKEIVTGELDQPEREFLLAGLVRLLEREPHIAGRDCGISQKYSWLLGHATRLVERMIATSDGGSSGFSDAVLRAIALAAQGGNYVTTYLRSDYELENLLSKNPALRHDFFWHCVEWRRRQMMLSGAHLTEWWQVGFIVHELVALRPEDFDMFLADIGNCEQADDRLVALTAAFAVWKNAGAPRKGRERMLRVVRGKPELETKLDSLLHPGPAAEEEARKHEERKRDRERQVATKGQQKEQARADIAKDLTAKASDIRAMTEHTKLRCFPALLWLARRISELADGSTRWGSDRWDLLEIDINREVAEAAREGLMRFWRLYTPQLRSESNGDGRTHGVRTGLTGLAIEARERPGWAPRITDDEARIAARYAMHEMNGLPDWAPDLMEAHPEAFDSVVGPELKWELPQPAGGPEHHHMISALRYGPEAVRQRYRPVLQTLLEEHGPVSLPALDSALCILLQGSDLDASRFATLARDRYEASADEGRRLTWLVAWMCVDAAGALDALRVWLGDADDPAEADSTIISFCNALMNHREPRFGRIWLDFERIEVLRELVPMVYRHVRIEEDNDHEGSYSPDARDDAESTRGYLLSLVAQTPGREAFEALMAFSQELPDQWSRDRMVVLARRRAAEDAEREAWSASDLPKFAKDAEKDPRSARDLFELACGRLDDLKLELEEGDASEAAILRRVDQETGLRIWFGNRLRRDSRGRYSVPPEEELADATRPDLRIHAAAIDAPVAVELKIADKWSYARLVERLRNQLVGQYLRDVRSNFAIFLLVWRGKKRTWKDSKTGQIFSFDELVERLQFEAHGIRRDRHDLHDISVVGIDLTQRHTPKIIT
jgi:hypothetical protein